VRTLDRKWIDAEEERPNTKRGEARLPRRGREKAAGGCAASFRRAGLCVHDAHCAGHGSRGLRYGVA
jgi:hypothetical protein